MPSPFEVDIPNARLPHLLEIFIKAPEDFRCVFLDDYEKASEAERHNWQKFLAHRPLLYMRKYPDYNYEGIFIALPPLSRIYPNADIFIEESPLLGPGQLDLRQSKFLGSGSHSDVFLAPFTLPPRETAAPLRGGVVVKIAKKTREDRDMLKNEAEIYDKFRATLQECNPSSPPIVPKFYGYYVPSWGPTYRYVDDEGLEAIHKLRRDAFNFLQYLGPILLLEFCGKPIRPERLSTIDWCEDFLPITVPRPPPRGSKSKLQASAHVAMNRNAITGMYERLHDAKFVQNSAYPRNILVQPGPLTHPPAERSLENPSYRLIDFGRGKYFKQDWSKSVKDDLKDEKKQVRRLKYDD